MPRRLYNADMDIDNLKAWRVERGLTQKQLAALLSCSRQTIISWENRRNPVPAWLPLALKGIELLED